MEKKIALITGANKGIGFETARQLGQKNVTVLVGARSREKAEDAAGTLRLEGLDAHSLVLDVTDPSSIKRAAAEVEQKFGRLDILVNNAGIMVDDRKEQIQQSLEIWRKTFETNLFGLIETTNAFLPLLRKSAAGRIVNLSSILAVVAAGLYAGWRDPLRMDALTRQTTWNVWSAVLFWLNGLAFVLLGLQLPAILQSISTTYSAGQLVWFLPLVFVALLAEYTEPEAEGTPA